MERKKIIKDKNIKIKRNFNLTKEININQQKYKWYIAVCSFITCTKIWYKCMELNIYKYNFIQNDFKFSMASNYKFL